MELFDALRRRRAVRDFTQELLPDQVLWKLVYAARRAPTGGNTPYRRILVVRDPKTVRLVKQVSPGILGTPTALLLIFTDLEVTKELGKLGNVCSIIDAGAAAENVALAAADLGIGACFTKSYSEAGVKEILNIPNNFRTEVMLQLGYPQDHQPVSMKPRKGADSVYIERFGRVWTK
jgi:nitroreductase